MYDVIIVGMGPAGMSAAIYAARAGYKTLVFEDDVPGGLLPKITVVDNYLGFETITGVDLAVKMFDHMTKNGVEYKFEKVLDIESNDTEKVITTTKNRYTCKKLIMAIGRKIKRTGVSGEDKYAGKGISYCALCDAPLYKDKKLIVIGGGNSAFEESLYLRNYTNDITILVRKDIVAEDELVNDCKVKGIKVQVGVSVTEFIGDERLTGVRLSDNSLMNVDGAFIYIGYEADAGIINKLKITDDSGYILVDDKMETKVKGVFACGDIIKKQVYQVINAAGEGAVAATCAAKELEEESK